ncbi:hypothetical protein [Pseudoduganella guangdongensis]|uniref:hypothetical protein n=1 Tax=Pseudoduganella guangdongensis TaxID=2692179 RepID=UPI001E4ACBE3|nr:hypothetical protein [Pseudoduganella guangdongensis]
MNPLRRAFAGALLALCTLPLQAADKTYGTHGMALFGGQEGLYASHLPMFHAPHDFQVILQIHIADKATDAALRKQLDGKTALWTIDPEKFELSSIAPESEKPRKEFRADLVQGHFERGGSPRFKGARIVIDKVIVFRQLESKEHSAKLARYIQLGSGKQRFLIKEINTRPDFDHIVAYNAAPGAPTGAIQVRRWGVQQTGNDALAMALKVNMAAIGGTVYFETGDLK